jgi:ribosome maturation factor RimP
MGPRQNDQDETGGTMSDAIIERVTRMIAPVVADLRLDLYDIEFRGGVLRVTIDTPPGSPSGVDIDTLALLTRMISRDFDHDDPMPGHYTLEVTSPGLERSLRTPTHFQREIGKLAAIRLRDVGGSERRLQGVIVSATDTDVTIRLGESDESDERTVAYSQIDRAKTVFVWGPAPKPGKGPSSKAGQKPTQKSGNAAGRKKSTAAPFDAAADSCAPTPATQEAS